MNKFLKWLLAGLGVVVLLIVIAAVVLPFVFDPNNYKEEISTAVLEKTGRDLDIGGEIKWSVFPSVGLELSDVRMSNREGFGDQPMLDIGAAGMSVKLLPLFSRRLEIGKISMADVDINLQRKANGQTNWEDLDQGQSTASGTSSERAGMGDFVISGIEISNANVTFNDAGQTTELKQFTLVASGIKPGQPFNLKGGFSVKLPEHELAGELEFDGVLNSSADGNRYGVDGLKLTFTGKQGQSGEEKSLDMSINTNADIDMGAQKAKLSGFVLRLHDLAVSGDLDVAAISSKPTFSGQLKLAEFNPVSLLQDLGMEPPRMMNGKALTRLQADMKFAGSATAADMQNLTIKLDESTFNGKLKVDNFDNPRLALDFQVDQLNLDDYSPAEQSTAAGSASASSEADLTVDDFRGFTGGGEFRVGRLVVAGMTATDASVTMNSTGKVIRFYPINANFYGGKHEGEMSIDASGARPMLSFRQGISGVKTESLLQDLSGTARLQGKGNFSLQIKTDLSNSKTMVQSLSGNIGMSVVDGAVVGIDVADTIGAVKSALGKQQEVSGETTDDKKTKFAELSMTGVIDQGIMRSDDLLMESTLLRATGKGSFNLVDETIDYVLRPVLLGDKVDKSLDALSGTPIPIKLTGNLYEPDFKVDIVAAIAGSQSELINQKKNELLGKLLGGEDDEATDTNEDGDEKKEDQVNSLLNNLLGGKKDKTKEDKDGGGH